MEQLNKELLKGSMISILLSVLSRKEMYGYEIIKAVERESRGGFQPKEGTIYPILHQLEKDGEITSRWDDTKGSKSRKYYRITASGKELLKKKTEEWGAFRATLDHLLSGKRLSEGVTK